MRRLESLRRAANEPAANSYRRGTVALDRQITAEAAAASLDRQLESGGHGVRAGVLVAGRHPRENHPELSCFKLSAVDQVFGGAARLNASHVFWFA